MMRPFFRPAAAALALAAALAGCSNRGDDSGATLKTLAALQAAIGRSVGGDAGTAQPPLTRAVLNTIDGEFIQARVEKTGSEAFMYISAERQGAAGGDEGGRLLVWRTENDVSLTLRDGVLVATRGLGGDLVSAQGGPALAAVRRHGAAQGSKRQVYSALDNRPVEMNFACAVDDMGAETIVIVERRHATRHLRETCELKGGTVVNDFWVDARGATVWQSRQWAGPNIGYISFRQLTP
ncbi:YjbF family lipoprotein [Marinibacterium sp. SX1]|uniref:YjbF family lipoprotein n=1 Tax=Marinibacterium sp. SX1 TaxID=3388424 RepID=UPI003D17DB80